MDEWINAETTWDIGYFDREHGLVTFIVTSGHQLHFGQLFLGETFGQLLVNNLLQPADELARQSFAEFLSGAYEQFPSSQRLDHQIKALNLSESQADKIFERYVDPIKLDFISIPIIYPLQLGNQTHIQWWDLSSYLGFILQRNIEPEDIQNLQTWNALVAQASDSVEVLKHPILDQPLDYRDLRLPSSEELEEFESLIAKNTHQEHATISKEEPTSPSLRP